MIKKNFTLLTVKVLMIFWVSSTQASTFTETMYRLDKNTGRSFGTDTQYQSSDKLERLEQDLAGLQLLKKKADKDNDLYKSVKLQKKIKEINAKIKSEKNNIVRVWERIKKDNPEATFDDLAKKVARQRRWIKAGTVAAVIATTGVSIAAPMIAPSVFGTAAVVGGVVSAASVAGVVASGLSVATFAAIENIIKKNEAKVHLYQWSDVEGNAKKFVNEKTHIEYVKVDKLIEMEDKLKNIDKESKKEKAMVKISALKILIASIQDGIRVKNPGISDEDLKKETEKEQKVKDAMKYATYALLVASGGYQGQGLGLATQKVTSVLPESLKKAPAVVRDRVRNIFVKQAASNTIKQTNKALQVGSTKVIAPGKAAEDMMSSTGVARQESIIQTLPIEEAPKSKSTVKTPSTQKIVQDTAVNESYAGVSSAEDMMSRTGVARQESIIQTLPIEEAPKSKSTVKTPSTQKIVQDTAVNESYAGVSYKKKQNIKTNEIKKQLENAEKIWSYTEKSIKKGKDNMKNINKAVGGDLVVEEEEEMRDVL